MKKKYFSILLCFSFACSSVSAQVLNDLSNETIFSNLYTNTFKPKIRDQDYIEETLPTIGIIENKQKYLGILHPIEAYKNFHGEERSLVFVEKRELSDIDEGFQYFSKDCTACFARVDLKIFKKNKNHQFSLVSESPINYESQGIYGISKLVTKDLKNRIVKVGNTKVGFFNTDNAYHHGTEVSTLNLIILDENQVKDFYITNIKIDDSGNYAEENLHLANILKGVW